MKKIIMFTLLTVAAGTTAIIASNNQYSFAAYGSTTASSEESALSVQNGKIYINNELVHDGFSVMQSEFDFIYFYVPEKGLFTVSGREFDGASRTGGFNGKKLAFDIDGLSVEMTSDSRILSEGDSSAWVKLDKEFSLKMKAVVFGYGGSEDVPYKWKTQMKFPD